MEGKNKLKPCPFCKGVGRVDRYPALLPTGNTTSFAVACEDCGSRGPNVLECKFDTMSEAERAAMDNWNIRGGERSIRRKK